MRLALWLAWPMAFRQRWLSIGLAPFLGHVTLPLTDALINPQAIAPAGPSQGVRQPGLLDGLPAPPPARRLERATTPSGAGTVGVDYRGRLRTVDTPVLVLGGSQDALATPEGGPRPGGAAGLGATRR